ncbi:porin family protein [Chitinophaga rhizosphaerae]|uniref:porin family protein n=1 Tax=Chitinophaga rhizosphaerae TaxID=1864947 RepID=UPI000F811B89|nr:porin family protein [Chitinophaga rhizosphaerae]
MKKSIFLFLTICLLSVAAQAQQVKFGMKGGLNVAKITNIDNRKSRPSIYVGGFARVGINEQWSIQPELVYSGQGFKIDPPFFDTYTEAVNYINLPVMAQYHIIPEFYLEAGPQIGFKVAAKIKNDGNSHDVGDAYKGVDFGLGFGLGYDFDFGLGVGARYNFGLTNAADTDKKHANSVAQFGVTYTFGNFRIKK